MTTAREPSCWDFPVLRQILPLRIVCINQFEFFRTGPTFDLFFPGQRRLDILGFLKMDETCNAIFSSKLAAYSLLMFEDPTNEIIGDACIQRFRPAAHDVDIIVFHIALVLSFQLSCCHPTRNTNVVILSKAKNLLLQPNTSTTRSFARPVRYAQGKLRMTNWARCASSRYPCQCSHYSEFIARK